MLLQRLLLFEKNVEKKYSNCSHLQFYCPMKSSKTQQTNVLALREPESTVSGLETWTWSELAWVCLSWLEDMS